MLALKRKVSESVVISLLSSVVTVTVTGVRHQEVDLIFKNTASVVMMITLNCRVATRLCVPIEDQMVEIIVLATDRAKVSLGFKAPLSVVIDRQEVDLNKKQLMVLHKVG